VRDDLSGYVMEHFADPAQSRSCMKPAI